jgi:DNA-binding beta-propeller fold protein YncE
VVSDEFSVLSSIDVESGEVVATIRNGDLGPVDITDWLTPSADGRFLYLSAFEHIARLDADTLEPVRTIDIGRTAGQQGNLAPMPGTDTMVGAAIQGRLLRIDMVTGDLTVGQSRDITSLSGVAVSPDGTMIAAGQPFTSSIALFDAETLQPIGRPIPAGEPSASPAFTTDGDLIADSRFGVSRWEMDPDDWQDTACSVAGRNLTRVEWEEYLGDESYRATCPRWPEAPPLT